MNYLCTAKVRLFLYIIAKIGDFLSKLSKHPTPFGTQVIASVIAGVPGVLLLFVTQKAQKARKYSSRTRMLRMTRMLTTFLF